MKLLSILRRRALRHRLAIIEAEMRGREQGLERGRDQGWADAQAHYGPLVVDLRRQLHLAQKRLAVLYGRVSSDRRVS